MKNTHKIIAFILSLLTVISATGNNGPVAVTKVEGDEKKITVMFNTVEGPVQLFYEPTEVTEFANSNEYDFIAVATQEIDIFYIGTDNEVEQINQGNYKRLVKKYLPNAPILHKRLGKRGFRFENLPSMVLYYNKRVLKKTVPLSKIDMIRISLS